jgi:acyl-CoA synthetase (AMP-forming)/AMP-acid ligase II
VWLGLLNYMKEHKLRFSSLKAVVIGGSACPPAMIRAFHRRFRHPRAACLGHDRDEPAGHGQHAQASTWAFDPRRRVPTQLLKQGRVLFGVEMKIVDSTARSCRMTARPSATCT